MASRPFKYAPINSVSSPTHLSALVNARTTNVIKFIKSAKN
jgi:hypothetical protein